MIEIIKKLKHPNLLEYFSGWYEENNHKAILITELLQGGNLVEHRKYQKKLKIKLIKKWIKQILSALDYLHSNGYIHHDVKCQNILVDRITGNLKVADLISVEKMDEKGYFTKYIGTEEFMAPEVKQGKYTFKADVYSLGITIIHFLTMEKPYKEFKKKKNLYDAKMNGIFPLSFSHIKNENIKKFISLCLKEEKDRPSCKELLENEWLNDKTSKENNTCVEIINNLRQVSFLIDNKIKFKSIKTPRKYDKEKYPYNLLGSSSNKKLLFSQSFDKPSSMKPVYSLDTSRINSTKSFKEKSCFKKIIKLNSFIGKKSTLNLVLKETKLSVNMLSTNERKRLERANAFSERVHRKFKSKNTIFAMFKEFEECIESINEQNNIRKKKTCLKNYNYTIYGYIYQFEEKLYFIVEEKQKQIENTLMKLKISASHKKFIKKKLSKVEIILKDDFKNNNIEIIIDILKTIIDLEKEDINIIKNILAEQIKKIIKDKKLRNLKDKIDEIINKSTFLLNNKEFYDLESLINKKDFYECKLPQDIIKKIEYYKEKKMYIETLIVLYNKNKKEDYNNNSNIQELLTLSINI